MSIRRPWTVEQDKVLKILKQQRNIKKWSSIARIMDYQFNMCGRNGKQCRQRYNNHLDQGILQKKLNFEQEKQLQGLNNKIGNKWSVIAKFFKGRTANFLKNQLYSKLRKSIRKLNKFMKEMKMKSNKPFKLNIVYKIVQSNDFKIYQKQRHTPDDLRFYQEIKEKLFKYADQQLLINNKEENEKNISIINQSQYLIENISLFSKKYENFSKKIKKPRKKYVQQDQIIINSLSNNRSFQKEIKHKTFKQKLCQQQCQQQQESNSDDNQIQQQQSQSSEKEQKIQNEGSQMRFFDTKIYDRQKQKDLSDNNYQHTFKHQKLTKHQKTSIHNHKIVNQIQKDANQNYKIVQQAQFEQFHGGYRLLGIFQNNKSIEQSSQQCNMIEIKYLQHFKSCSLIDQSLFQ